MKISGIQNNNYNLRTQKKNINNKKGYTQSFKSGLGEGVFNLIDKAFSILDKNAMIQVSFVDTVSTNIPRTLVDLKTGLAAAFETCRREFSGLFVNCLMPGLVVKAIAALLPKSNILKDTQVVSSWANGNIIDKLQSVYSEAKASGAENITKEYVTKALSSLEGLEGKTWVKYADKAQTPEFTDAVEKITKAISSKGKERKILLEDARQKLVGITKAESILKFKNSAQSNLTETLRDITDIGSKYNAITEKGISVNEYSSALKNFVNKKSLIGMALVIGIAVSVQTINRAITRKQFKAAGAPIYKEFGKKDTTQKMDEKQKKRFKAKKIASAAGMYGLAAVSMMKKPTLGMFQFSNIFPTMDQCRWIAASTFASRMLGAEDENELRETTVRDIASFSGLYFLGDYVKKGAASIIEAFSKTKKGAELLGGNVVLLNRRKEIAKPVLESGASASKKLASTVSYRLKQFGNWIKNTDLKTAGEVSSIKVRNLRNICRIADIAFSIIMLGVLLPKYNRSVTEKKVAEAKKREEMQRKIMQNYSNAFKKRAPEVFKEFI